MTLCLIGVDFANSALSPRSPRYLYELLPLQTGSYITRSSNNISCFHFKDNLSKNYYFTFASTEYIYKELRKPEELSCNLQDLLQVAHTTASTTNELNTLPDYVLV